MHVVIRLSLSGYIFDDLELSEEAAKVLRTWFINTDTSMRPSLRFGQGIPGKFSGKASACMDMYFSGRGFIDAIQLLQQTPGVERFWTWYDRRKMRQWASTFSRYLYENNEVVRESLMKNNHGAYYDVTLLSWATLGGETEIIQSVNGTSDCSDHGFCILGRVENQIDESGMLKYEIHRADPGHYLWYTLLANAYLANIADRIGNTNVFKSTRLCRAADWALPYLLSSSSSRIEGRNEYAVHAYRIFARGTYNPKYEDAVCLSLHAQIEDHHNHFWSSHKVGIHVLNIVMPSIHSDKDKECAIWEQVKQLHKDKGFRKYWDKIRKERRKRQDKFQENKLKIKKGVILIISCAFLLVLKLKRIKILNIRNKMS